MREIFRRDDHMTGRASHLPLAGALKRHAGVLRQLEQVVAGFAFGGAYSLYTQNKPVWTAVLVGFFGVVAVVAGVLYL